MTIANTGKLAGRTLFISGASRGIGKAIALKAAQDGANVVIAAKTATAHPKLPGTVYSAAEEVEKAGGKALACVVDIRDEASVKSAVQAAVEKFGGIDIVVNNASAISLTSTEYTTMKSYDLMNQINARGTFLVSKECIPYLKKSPHPHILNLSPPLNMAPFWFSQHVAYTIAKYGMSMCALGMAAEYRENGIGVNTLWPKTAILTAAVEMLTGPDSAEWSRKPEIVADAAYVILTSDPKKTTGNFFIDEDVVKNAGVTDLTHYACIKENADKLLPDAFLEVPPELIAQSWNKGNLSDVAIKHLEAAGVKTGAKTGASAGAPSSGGGQIEGLFQKIESLLNEDIVKRTNAVFQFEVKGEEAGTWFADLKNGKGAVGRGSPPSQADATLIMDSQNFFNMFSGKLKPASAFMTGKLKIKGDMKKAMALEKLMGGLKSKL